MWRRRGGGRSADPAGAPPRSGSSLPFLLPSLPDPAEWEPVGSGAVEEHGCGGKRPGAPPREAGVASLADEDDDDDDKEEEEAAGSGDATVGFVLF